ncbi:GNAT family N-acetyltransferase [Botrimarina sp.]|uniref:GNAT family N-acetyltransferase n=1 Tax=Botrimarina sp. TaxID=2795802 RepID=UPI0032ED6BEB
MPELVYEPLREEHAAELYDGLSEAAVYAYLDERRPASQDALRRGYRALAAGPPEGSGQAWLNWAVRERSTGRCVAVLQATLDTQGELWFGYKVVPAWWGRGVATQSVRWLLAELRERFPTTPALASVDKRNVASVCVLQKCGLRLLRSERTAVNGELVEELTYGAGEA